MSVSKTQLHEFAKYVKGHEAFDVIIERVQKNLFNQSIKASKEQRDILSDTALGLLLFVDEINRVFAEITADAPINDE